LHDTVARIARGDLTGRTRTGDHEIRGIAAWIDEALVGIVGILAEARAMAFAVSAAVCHRGL